jgi:hypothetical protein
VHTAACFVFLFIIGFSLPSIITFIYALSFFALFLIKALRHKTLGTLLRAIFVPLFLLVLLHMITMWIFQVKWISDWMSADMSSMLGFINYRSFAVDMHSLQYIVSWAAVEILFILVRPLSAMNLLFPLLKLVSPLRLYFLIYIAMCVESA